MRSLRGVREAASESPSGGPSVPGASTVPGRARGSEGGGGVDLLFSQDFFPQLGGAHHWMYEVYRRWPTSVLALVQDYSGDPTLRGYQADFDSRPHGSLQIRRCNLAGGDINIFRVSYWRGLWRNWRALRGIEAYEGGRLHALRSFPEGIPAMLWKMFGRKGVLITYVHGEELLVAETSRQLQWLARQVYRMSDLVIANSRNTRRMTLDLCPGANVVVIHPGVDCSEFAVEEGVRERFRNRWGWGKETVVVATVARMEPRKNHATVLRALAKLRAEGHQVGYVIGGVGEERSALESLSRELGVVEDVRFMGRLSKQEQVGTFASADIHVMPSVRAGAMVEGFGIVFLEAAAAGIPSVGGCNGGQPEAVLDGETGIVVDGTDVAEVTGAIRRLVVDPELRARMGAAGRRWAQANDWSEVRNRTVDAVESVSAGVRERPLRRTR